MGANTSTALQPEELVTFKKLEPSIPLSSIEIPERTENRKPTNAKWLLIMGGIIVLLIPFLAYTLAYSDIERLLYGYDQCGNVCGKRNSKYSGIDCSGADMTSKPFLQSESGFNILESRECVEYCSSGYIEAFGQCRRERSRYRRDITDSDDVEVEFMPDNFNVYFNSVKWQIIICCLLSVLISLGMVFAFRHATGCVVWTILIISYTLLLLIAIGFWIGYALIDENNKGPLVTVAIFWTVFALVLGAMLLWFRKKIALVILLLKEATKAVFDMPATIFVPVVTFLAIFIITIIYGVVTMAIISSGSLTEIYDGYYFYHFNDVMNFTAIFNTIVFIWTVQFITGIQYMVIAGAVAQWYFCRDKSNLQGALSTSIKNTFRFHLGSVALGAWIITITTVIKNFILSLAQNEKVKLLLQFLLEPIERLIKYLSKNSYIMTAIHGQAFLKSGRRAAKILLDNLGDVVAINYIGDLVLGMAKLLIIIITILISIGVFAVAPSAYPNSSNIFAYLIIGVIALVAACMSFAVFETTIDTLFICYCEDRLMNDGTSKPFFMSRNLMEFIEDSKKVYAKKQPVQ